MTPQEIKAELVRHKAKQVEIARACGKSPQLVHDVIGGARRNPAIEQEVAARIGRSVSDVFGAAA